MILFGPLQLSAFWWPRPTIQCTPWLILLAQFFFCLLTDLFVTCQSKYKIQAPSRLINGSVPWSTSIFLWMVIDTPKNTVTIIGSLDLKWLGPHKCCQPFSVNSRTGSTTVCTHVYASDLPVWVRASRLEGEWGKARVPSLAFSLAEQLSTLYCGCWSDTKHPKVFDCSYQLYGWAPSLAVKCLRRTLHWRRYVLKLFNDAVFKSWTLTEIFYQTNE